MASLNKTLTFILTFFWVTSKIQILAIFVTLSVYFFDYGSFYKIIFSINNFILNLIIFYSVFKKDEYLRSDRFYKVFSISDINIFISKCVIIFWLLSAHLLLFLLLVLKVSFIVYLVFNFVILLAFVNNIIFFQLKGKVPAFIILALIVSCIFLIHNLSEILLLIILFLVISLFLLFRVLHNYNAKFS
jgi:hypothetical protein